MINTHDITGLVLAGGLGTRMGHGDKGMLPLHGQPLARHVLQRLAPQVGQLAISANAHADDYARFGLPVWRDVLPGQLGPLAGLHSGMRHATTPYLLTVPCDSPLLPPDLAARLAAGLIDNDADLAIAVTEELDEATGQLVRRPHPVFCLVKTSALPQLEAYLAAGERRMRTWHGPLALAEVLFHDGSAFGNVNTPEDLAALQAQGLSVPMAQAILADSVAPVAELEHLALPQALERILAADIISPISVPAHDNSAMDGYALHGEDLGGDAAVTLAVVDTILAGRPGSVSVQRGQCARIMTGAVMPAGCDSVVPQELVRHAGDSSISVAPDCIRPGDNRRFKGEDLMQGQPALLQGKRLGPAELGLLASLGIATVPVRRRLRVAFFSTGDELRSIGEPLAPGCIYDSNRYTLLGMLTRLGCEVLDMGIVKDNPQALEAALRGACAQADVIITSGGVSSGAADFTREILARLGDVSFWQINMRPGRPMAFGNISSEGHAALLLGLPGNPVAVMAAFYFLARPTLLRLMGADADTASLPLLQVAAQAPIRKKRGRTEYQRGIVERGADGRQHVRVTGAQGSGILRSMTQANCMIVLHAQQGHVAAGDLVDIVLFHGLT
ncbi:MULTISPECIES: gephyrin-like molybdotransferase Glp [unclassified Janthinobacterium]|uniref:molybdopterin molybdotransferase MoeA n=1 Tax=unclassified Janthinobacterium TaxID=2610881 RepID=UPI0008891EF4|nr:MULTISPECIES: gephyrin-like molybdotransferase Glp [unclassified Janthinobacterium]SDA44961.1 molybdopterin molybdotransferase [Janthinobacterium sp. 551a]SFA95246.1 molybdopterin molybdotransferase [Janthinobacterium sp. 344]